MIGLIGIVIIFLMVFGGYLASGGKMAIIVKSLPYEMVIIGGAAVGAFTISNDMASIKHALKDVGKVFKGPRWKPAGMLNASSGIKSCSIPIRNLCTHVTKPRRCVHACCPWPRTHWRTLAADSRPDASPSFRWHRHKGRCST